MNNRFAIIENDLVVNVVLGQPEIKSNQILVECPNAGIGWKYIDGNFVEPDEPEVTTTETSKEELLRQLQVLQAKIEALS